MELPDDLNSKSIADLEDAFLSGLSTPQLPPAPLLRILTHLRGIGEADKANELAEMLLDTTIERGDRPTLLILLRVTAAWHPGDRGHRERVNEALSRVFKDPMGRAITTNSGFDTDLPLDECFRRMDILMTLKAGMACHESTWGFGIVKKVDDFYKKVTVDFKKKPDHQLSFAYAAEVLELIGEDHILARLHANPAAIHDLVSTSPAEVVKMTIRSYGAMNAVLLKERLVEGEVLSDSDWKRFWDAARKVLKNDPLVDVPSSRSEPIVLRVSERAYDLAWFAGLKAERYPETILALVTELEENADISSFQDNFRAIIAERLAFAHRGAGRKEPGLAALAIMAAKRTGIPTVQFDWQAATCAFMDPELFLASASSMPAREIRRFIAHLAEHDAKKVEDLLVSLLPLMEVSILNDAVEFLAASGRDKDCAGVFRNLATKKMTGVEILFWLFKHTDKTREWSIVKPYDLISQTIDSFAKTCTGERLKTQNQLKLILEQKGWVKEMLQEMEDFQRVDLLRKVSTASGWEQTSRRSVMAAMIKAYPELEKSLSSAEEKKADANRFTSWRSYKERQEQYRKLLEEQIPRNSREIAVARSYGDLRENAEYKAAKEHQGVLLRRQGEMEIDLSTVKGSDFIGVATEMAGMGTSVTVQHPDGRTETFNILGEWDGNETLHIISSKSELAAQIIGRRTGEDVLLPTPAGSETCRVVSVSTLPDEIRAWMQA